MPRQYSDIKETNGEVLKCSFDTNFKPNTKQLAYAPAFTGEVDDSDHGQNRNSCMISQTYEFLWLLSNTYCSIDNCIIKKQP